MVFTVVIALVMIDMQKICYDFLNFLKFFIILVLSKSDVKKILLFMEGMFDRYSENSTSSFFV